MKIYVEKMVLILKEKFKISHSEFDRLEHILVILEGNGLWACGEIVPIEFFHEPYDRAYREAVQIIEKYGEDIKRIQDVAQAGDFVFRLTREGFLNCTICGFEMAVLDYLGKKKEIPLWKLLGLSHPGVRQSAVTLPIKEGDPGRQIGELNSGIVKIKLGGPNDAQYLDCIKQDWGKTRFFVDMNQGWSVEALAAAREQLCSGNLVIIEEPVKLTDVRQVREIKDMGLIPQVFLDESVKSAADALRYLPYIDGINIKIVKFGGLFRSMATIRQLEGKNVRFLLGCFLESGLSIAYAFHVSSLFDYIDLDGATFIKNDPFSGLDFKNGIISLPESGYGIGVKYG